MLGSALFDIRGFSHDVPFLQRGSLSMRDSGVYTNWTPKKLQRSVGSGLREYHNPLIEFVAQRGNRTTDLLGLAEEIVIGHAGDEITHPGSGGLALDVGAVEVVEKINGQ